jgi:hypothetical protein
MDNHLDQYEPGSTDISETSTNQVSPLLTVSQAYEYLIADGLPRSKKTISSRRVLWIPKLPKRD